MMSRDAEKILLRILNLWMMMHIASINQVLGVSPPQLKAFAEQVQDINSKISKL